MRTMSQPWARAIVALVLVVSLATGCGDDESGDDVAASTSGPASATSGDSTASTPSGEAGKEAQKLTVTATDFAFEGIPDEITAGAVSVTFTNDGSVLHDLGFVQVAEDTTLAQFDKDFPPVVEGGPFPDYAEAVVVPVQAEPGASAEADFLLTPGRYVALCGANGDPDQPAQEDGSPAEGMVHSSRGMAKMVTVVDGDDSAELAEADGTITAKDHSFDADLEAGDQSILFVNEGPDEVHFASIMAFPEGTTAVEAEKAFEDMLNMPEDQPPPADFVPPEEVAFTGIASTGLDIRTTMAEPLENGRTYLLVCFIQDRAGGPPHAIANKMYKAITIE